MWRARWINFSGCRVVWAGSRPNLQSFCAGHRNTHVVNYSEADTFDNRKGNLYNECLKPLFLINIGSLSTTVREHL